ncbi:hypothetical protein KIW84_053734 [Lathyrus oleraceus]|uniref:Uncharacterized protein n=1 Tax=Pisum sativum TaxID=3888 RepID=A0A9D5AH85_PEA|nr:hypothetical protein KIW84_053734 [Pisum sativum]
MEKSPQNLSCFRHSPQNKFELAGEKEKSVATRDSNSGNKGTSSPSGVQQGKTPVQRQNNPHVIPTRDTCYHCNGRGHKSNVFPTRKDVVIAKEREWEEEREKPTVENNEYARVEFAEEEFDVRINFMLHRILLASKEERQHMNLFKTHCYIKNKVLEI